MICNEYKIINEKVYTHTLNNGMKLTLVKKEGFKGFFCGIIVSAPQKADYKKERKQHD